MPKAADKPTSAFSLEIARILTDAMDAAGATKKQAALNPENNVGISRTMLIDKLAGKKHFNLDELDRLCAYLGLDMFDVIDEADRNTAGRELPQPLKTNVVTFPGPVRAPRYVEDALDGGLDVAAHDGNLSDEPDSV